MHWTLQIFVMLSLVTFIGTFVQLALVRSVPIGFWVCTAWAMQQAYWLANGVDNVALFLVCDCIIMTITFQLRGRWQAQCVFGLTMLSVSGWAYGGAFGWWWSTYCVMASMILGLPWVERAGWRWPKRGRNYGVA